MQLDTLFATLKAKLVQLTHKRPSLKQVGIFIATLVGVVVLINLVMLWYYQDRFYPNLQAGAVNVGGLTQSRARQVLADVTDRRPVTLKFGQKTDKVPTKEFGVEYDLTATIDKLNKIPRPAIPLLALLQDQRDYEIPLQYRKDDQKFSKKLDELISKHKSEPKDAMLNIIDGQAAIEPHQLGRDFDKNVAESDVLQGIERLSSAAVEVRAKILPVKVTTEKLQPALLQAQQKLDTKIELVFNDKKYEPTRNEIGSWLAVNDQQQISVNESAVAKYIETIAEEIDIATQNEVVTIVDGVETERKAGEQGRILNRADTTQAILKALADSENSSYKLKAEMVEPTIEYVRKYTFSGLNYSYCVQANGVSEAMLGSFAQKISSTLSSANGWGLNGQIRFSQVAGGCNFNLILAAAYTLPAYSSGCSIYWSCRVGSNVIINIDRWNGASDSWNRAGGSLDGYQTMVINHEVGHWLGFDHWTCGGPGQPAPVMLQQSIDLQGCAFNVWPSPAELTHLRRLKGI